MKDKICKCEIPHPKTKCSENGILTYCTKCQKKYETKN